jgi:hypothetical protein
MKGIAFEIAPVCSWSAAIDRSVPIGDTAEGLLSVGYLTEGRVTGPRIVGTLVGGSADWAVVRRDGILRPHVNLLINTDDGATIMVTYDGFVDFGPDGYEKRRRGERVGSSQPRTLVRMLSEAPAYAWVNRSPFFGVGLLEYTDGRGVITYDIYEIAEPKT